MFGRFFFFLAGMYAGVIANQRYRIPEAPTPGEAWRDMWERLSSSRDNGVPTSGEKEREAFEMPQELREAIDKIMALEKKYRRDYTGDSIETTSTTAGNGDNVQMAEAGGSASSTPEDAGSVGGQA